MTEENTGVMPEPTGDGVDASPASNGVVNGSSPEPKAIEEGQQLPAEEKEEEENLPFGKHPRWQKLQSERKALAEKLKNYEALGDTENLKDALMLAKDIQERPDAVLEWLNKKLNKNSEHPKPEQKKASIEIDELEKSLDAFEPEAAKAIKFLLNKVRQYDQLVEDGQQERKEWETQTEQEKSRQIHDNQEVIDASFDTMAKESGFLDKDGNGDETFMTPLARHTMSELMAIAKNPKMPTTEELKIAFDATKKWMEAVGKKAQGAKVIVTPPSSASKTGGIPTGKQFKTYEEAKEARIKNMVQQLGG